MATETENVETSPAEPAAEVREPVQAAEPQEPVQTAPEATEPRQAIQFIEPEVVRMPADEVESALDQAIAAIDGDEMLSSGQKAGERARLLAQKATYRTGREDRQRQIAREEWDNEASTRGAPRQKLESLWQQARAQAAQKYPRAGQDIRQGAALVIYEQLADGLKNQPAPAAASEQQRQTATRTVGATRAIPRATPSAPAPPTKKMTVSEMIEQGKLPDNLSKQLEAELM